MYAMQALMSTLAVKDLHVYEHSRRVASWAKGLALKAGLDNHSQDVVWTAGMLHDIGKIGISDNILSKPGALTAEERKIIQMHPKFSCQIATHIETLREDILPVILHHHERIDGRGYPDGIKGSAIPLAARILSIADSWDAMVSHRSYRNALPVKSAIAELKRHKDFQFDSDLVDLFMDVIKPDQKADSGMRSVVLQGVG